MSNNNTQDVEKPDVLPASRKTGEVSEAVTEGLPPGAYDPRKDETYQERIKSNVPEQTNRKEGVYGVGEGED